MKSSITTKSRVGNDSVIPAPNALLPVVIRTRAITGTPKSKPKKEKLSLPASACASKFPSWTPFLSKY